MKTNQTVVRPQTNKIKTQSLVKQKNDFWFLTNFFVFISKAISINIATAIVWSHQKKNTK